MKTVYFLIPFLFLGCTPKTEYIYETKYVYQKVPPIHEKPNNPEVNFKVVQFNDQEMLCLSKGELFQLGQNWIDYKSWSENNFDILKSLERNATKETK